MAFFSSLLCNIIANYWSHLRVAKEERSRKLILIIWCGFTGGTLIAFNSSGHLLLLRSSLPILMALLQNCIFAQERKMENKMKSSSGCIEPVQLGLGFHVTFCFLIKSWKLILAVWKLAILKQRLRGLVVLVCLTLVSFGTIIHNIMAHVGGPFTLTYEESFIIAMAFAQSLFFCIWEPTLAVIPKGY